MQQPVAQAGRARGLVQGLSPLPRAASDAHLTWSHVREDTCTSGRHRQMEVKVLADLLPAG